MSTSTKDFYALNLTDTQCNKLISKIECDITSQMSELSEKVGPLTEMEEMYLTMKAEIDKLEFELSDNKNLLEALVRFKTNEKPSKEIRILRTTSNLDTKERQHRYFKWIKMTVTVLSAQGRFMSPEEIFSQLLVMYPDVAKAFPDKSRLTQVKNTTFHNINRACSETRKNNSGKLIDYNKKIGLLDWVMDDFTPEAKYIKEFMHGSMRATG